MTKYCKAKIDECEAWVREYGLMDCGGATLKAFCEAMAINLETYRHWMRKSAFSDAIKRAKEAFRSQAEEKLVVSMFRMATGYETEETRTELRPNPEDASQPRIARQEKVRKHVAPNVAAAIFLLTNVAPERWVNRQRQDVSVRKDAGENMTREEITAELARLRSIDELEDGTGSEARAGGDEAGRAEGD